MIKNHAKDSNYNTLLWQMTGMDGFISLFMQ